ncbi:MAG: Carboxy-terminal-processing protease [Candidatus Giovannonibacteria bacterium GW2011_GWB1_45_9b]|uniref:PDZ domain-containing protein n=7 Tax=Candidatus Giovannoniibacteriota TaxID=1752738 RepID=A0A1F5WZN3_9BACT|nr:MAG: Carboxy-terminal-processing protease [Candidatus Giovannonibacteria bacterium GW2011_GWA2_44_26]KKT78738.1 MAG: Carboxy-terminal-processing protease [Candidatus Giovannonibacteria bacterium GW2011_GWC2_44_8]KKU15958.1 MAG: Carboxy-terminal-processing protease [Candidatus Giovannonibacteria bacterium GW2011_GWB1_45_9b]OGF73394.1 MAG: hypothetical protein A2W57_02035 [Candidatus Giovannonibacteria bacterium RIFCSPHIGHO2_02_43_16]OGF81115.1 MAG: hypothetical protein A2W48_02780 [Candidatus
MEISGRRKIYFILSALIVISASFALGAAFGYNQRPEIERVLGVINKSEPIPDTIDFSPFWKVWRIVGEKYGLPEEIDRQKMVWGAINGLLSSLDDPYTVFFPPAEKELFESEIRGNFEGVGMEIALKDGVLTVIAPLKGTPAANAGIKAGDKILKIDDRETDKMSVEEAVSHIRGPKGSSVKLTVFSSGADKPRDLNVVRDTIQVPAVETETNLSDGVFIIKINSFSERAAFEFQKALREFVLSKTNKLIIDVRGNPGGYLDSAVEIASWFLEIGKPVLREKYKDGKEDVLRSRGYNAFPSTPIVVLINEGSASASEILAGALRDNGKAKLVGKKTFGKGSVQEPIDIKDSSLAVVGMLKITIARWLTPNGEDITKQGIKPDYEIDNATPDEVKAKKDPQISKALEILKDWPLR